MKRKLTSIFTLIVILLIYVPANAAWVDNNTMRIEYGLPDYWICTQSDADNVNYYNSLNESEFITIETISSPYAFSYDALSYDELEKLKQIIGDEGFLSNNGIKQSIMRASNITGYLSVSTNSMNWNEVTYNGVKYLKGEKFYTVRSTGFYDAVGHRTCCITFKNGICYLTTYQCVREKNNYSDYINMMNDFHFDEISITVNGQLIYPDTHPVLINGRTLVPIRAVAETLGYNVGWESVTQTVQLVRRDGKRAIELTVGDSSLIINNSQQVALDVPPIIIGGRTYLPLRAVAEAMNTNVNWNSEAYRAEISTK